MENRNKILSTLGKTYDFVINKKYTENLSLINKKQEMIIEDKSIESYQVHDHIPTNLTQLNEYGTEITIPINNQDIKTYPHKSFLIIRGKLEAFDKEQKKLDKIDSKISFVNNGLMNLFSKISYFVGSTEIASIDNPGLTTTMKGIVSFSSDDPYNISGWKINSKTNIINSKGYFSVAIPFSNIMGFFEDFRQYIFRINQEIRLYRANDDNNVLLVDGGIKDHTFKINITELLWRMPHIKFALEYEHEINKQISSNKNFDLYFRNWKYFSNTSIPDVKEYTWRITTSSAKPRFVLIGFQTDKNRNIHKDNGQFDFCNLENLQVCLNTTKYPYNELRLSQNENKYDIVYNMFSDFKDSYYGENKFHTPLINFNDFLYKYPIFVVDCSKQNEVIKEAMIDVKIEFKWKSVFPVNTIVHCLIISDDHFTYNPLNNDVLHV